MKSKISVSKELQFLIECEANKYYISAKERFIEILKVLRYIPEPSSILDVGGNISTAEWLKTKFPKSKVIVLNNNKRQVHNYQSTIIADAQSFETKEKYDLIFAGEIIEHIYNPDGLICSCISALKPRGYFIITTPNLSCLYNRLLLLFGWSLANYSPSLRFRTGNPFASLYKNGEYGDIGDHKSVFTFKGLKNLLQIYGFNIISSRGYSYIENSRKTKTTINRSSSIPFRSIRFAINKMLPYRYKEGMLFVCQAPNEIDQDLISKGILKEELWQIL